MTPKRLPKPRAAKAEPEPWPPPEYELPGTIEVIEQGRPEALTLLPIGGRLVAPPPHLGSLLRRAAERDSGTIENSDTLGWIDVTPPVRA